MELEFKKSSKKKAFRKRPVSDDEHEEDSKIVSASQLKKRKSGKTQEERDDIHIDENMTALGVAFKSSGTAVELSNNSATRTLDIDGAEDGVIAGDQAEKLDNLYTGKDNYKEYINKKKEKITQKNAGGIRAGPLKGQTNVRISCRFDYAPAICKDYKETGYCGFGDGCVFMHDRGDYKMGWELDKEWEEMQRKKAEENDPNRFFVEVEDEVESDDDLPFACLICRGDFKSPIVTKCKHYFCEACAIKHFKKSPGCFACNQNTQGVFNVAKELIGKLDAKKKRMKEKELEIQKQMQEEE
ncbi:hypothetical protein HDV06_000571 [Boothiomyces sp. JEL0866]|nr:hypothetical protein HDV06_000571 [Boothiomyces sp. JEL0866]